MEKLLQHFQPTFLIFLRKNGDYAFMNPPLITKKKFKNFTYHISGDSILSFAIVIPIRALQLFFFNLGF